MRPYIEKYACTAIQTNALTGLADLVVPVPAGGRRIKRARLRFDTPTNGDRLLSICRMDASMNLVQSFVEDALGPEAAGWWFLGSDPLDVDAIFETLDVGEGEYLVFSVAAAGPRADVCRINAYWGMRS